MLMGLLRTFFGSLDIVVYSLLSSVFQLIIDLSNVQIFTDSTIDHFSKRIYLILGLVMLFKVIISFVQILVNPDKMDDKEQGVGNVLQRVVISLALIFLVPSIFDFARSLQSKVIPVIPKIVLASSVDLNSDTSEQMNSIGQRMAFQTFLAFFDYDNPSCDHGEIFGTGNNLTNTFTVVPEIVSVPTAVSKLTQKDSCSNDENQYKYSYRMVISTAVGVYLLLTMVGVAISVAVRAIKLAICEFIAPIPIASYVDPKTSKQTFENWIDISIKTYLDLFASLIVVFFVAFVFLEVFKRENLALIYSKLGNNGLRYVLVTLFIILALIRFVKEAPKFISDMLGVKEGGSISGIFRDAGSLLRGSKAMLDTFSSNRITQKERLESQGKKFAGLRALGSGVAGAASANARLLRAVAQGKSGQDIRNDTFGAAIEARNRRNYRKDVAFSARDEEGNRIYTRRDYREDRRRQRLGVPSRNEFYQSRYSGYNDLFSGLDSMAKHGLGKMMDNPSKVNLNFEGADQKRVKMSLAEVYALANREEGKEYEVNEYDMDGNLTGVTRRTWTAADKALWQSNKQLAEKQAQYVKESELLRKGDAGVVRSYENIQKNFYKNIDNVRNDIGIFRQHFNSTVDSNHQLSSDDKVALEQLTAILTDRSKVTADVLQGLKTGFDELSTYANKDSNAAADRQQLFQQADSGKK